MFLTLLVFLTASSAHAQAPAIPTPKVETNRAATAEALDEMARKRGKLEAEHFAAQLERFAAEGVRPGPLCLEMTVKGEARPRCVTQRQLGYQSSEYYEVAGLEIPKMGYLSGVMRERFADQRAVEQFRAMGVSAGVQELVLLNALPFQERLARAYVQTYERSHPLPAAGEDARGYYVSHEWRVDQDGQIYQKTHRSRMD